MKTLALSVLTALALVSFFPAGTAWGQVQPPSPPADTFTVGFYVNANTAGVGDGTVFITNPGTSGGDLCADIYVFDANGEMATCCGCPVPLDGLLTLSINDNLTQNALTGIAPTQGVIKIISSSESISLQVPKCDPRYAKATPTLRGDREIPEKHPSGPSPGSEGHKGYEMHDAPLSSKEENSLKNQCAVIAKDGSGHGVCSCGSAS